jgi:hypothetical protein
MTRPVDIISLEGERGALRIFDSVEVTNDITAPASAIFRILYPVMAPSLTCMFDNNPVLVRKTN